MFARTTLPLTCLAVALTAVLAGCQPTPSRPDARGPVPASSAPTAAPAAALAPVSLIGTDCGGLVPLAAVQSALGPDVAPVASTVPDFSTDWTPLVDTAIAQDGGLKCVWRNGAYDAVDVYRAVTLTLLPNASRSWAAHASLLHEMDDAVDILGGAPVRYGDESISDCGGEEDPWYYGTCYYNVRVGDYWLSVVIEGMAQDSPEHAGRPVLEAATAAIVVLPTPAAAWTPPPGSAALAPSCDEAVPLASARATMGIPTLVLEDASNTGAYEVETGALSDARALNCVWITPSDWVDPAGESYGLQVNLVAIPGGVWAWSGTSAPPHADGYAFAPVTGIGDAAWGGCRTDYDACQLQVLSHGTWFIVDGGGTHGSLSPLIGFGAAIIASSH